MAISVKFSILALNLDQEGDVNHRKDGSRDLHGTFLKFKMANGRHFDNIYTLDAMTYVVTLMHILTLRTST